jgi:chaperonin GroES
MSTLRPTGNRVLVQPLQASSKSAGGIHLAETWLQPSGRGIILGVGGRVQDGQLKPGARVFYSWINGVEVEHEGRTCRLLHAEELLGVEV